MIDIFVINLKHRTDRLSNFKKKFDKYFNINVIEAVENEEGWRGCIQSHIKCIKHAKENNLKYIIVFEDDAIPMYEDFFEKFKKIKEDIFDKKNDWDIFIGGSARTFNFNKYVKIYDSKYNLYSTQKTRNTHSIVYNNTSYDFFLNSDLELPIDEIWYDKLNAIIPIPFLFTCINGFSNISNKKLNIKDRIKQNEKQLMKGLNIK